MAALTVKIETDLGPIEDLLADINGMQTYKLFENDDMLLVDKADLCEILVRHLKARRADESPDTAADVVARDCYDKILWENDIMRQQLADIGKKFGEKMDDVRPVVLCGECKHRFNYSVCACRGDDWFCAYGERKKT